jgi:hypothetical protein
MQFYKGLPPVLNIAARFMHQNKRHFVMAFNHLGRVGLLLAFGCWFWRVHQVTGGQSHQDNAYEYANHTNRMAEYKSAQQPQDHRNHYR